MVKALPEEEHMTEAPKKHSFANLDAAARSEVASMGGKAAHIAGTAHKFNADTARQASLKGVATRRANAAKRAALLQQNREVQS